MCLESRGTTESTICNWDPKMEKCESHPIDIFGIHWVWCSHTSWLVFSGIPMHCVLLFNWLASAQCLLIWAYSIGSISMYVALGQRPRYLSIVYFSFRCRISSSLMFQIKRSLVHSILLNSKNITHHLNFPTQPMIYVFVFKWETKKAAT